MAAAKDSDPEEASSLVDQALNISADKPIISVLQRSRAFVRATGKNQKRIPARLRLLVHRQAVHLDHHTFDTDVENLLHSINEGTTPKSRRDASDWAELSRESLRDGKSELARFQADRGIRLDPSNADSHCA